MLYSLYVIIVLNYAKISLICAQYSLLEPQRQRDTDHIRYIPAFVKTNKIIKTKCNLSYDYYL